MERIVEQRLGDFILIGTLQDEQCARLIRVDERPGGEQDSPLVQRAQELAVPRPRRRDLVGTADAVPVKTDMFSSSWRSGDSIA